MTDIEYKREILNLELQFKMIGVSSDQFKWATQKTIEYAQTTTRPNSEVVIEKLKWLHLMIVRGIIKIDKDWTSVPLLNSQNS